MLGLVSYTASLSLWDDINEEVGGRERKEEERILTYTILINHSRIALTVYGSEITFLRTASRFRIQPTHITPFNGGYTVSCRRCHVCYYNYVGTPYSYPLAQQ